MDGRRRRRVRSGRGPSGERRGHAPRRRARGSRRPLLLGLRLRRARSASPTSSPTSRARSRSTGRRSGTPSSRCGRAGSSGRRGSSARPGRTSCGRCCASGAERDEVRVVDDQRGSPTYVGHLAAATRELIELPGGIWHLAADGECTWADFAEAIFEEAGLDCRVVRITTAEFGAPAPRPAYSVLRSERPDAPRLPHWREGLRECLARLRPRASLLRVRVLVTGGAGFIGSHFVKRLVAAPVTTSSCSTSSPTRETPRTSRASRTAFVQGDIADPAAVAEAGRGRRGARQLRRRDARRPLDPRGRRLHPHGRLRDARAARVGPRRRVPASCRSRRTRSTATCRRERVPRGGSAAPVEPLRGLEGRRRPPGARVRPDVRGERLDHPRLEHVRPEPVSGEADPALRHERARRRAAPALRRRAPDARLAARRGSLRGDRARPVARAARARSTTSAAARRSRTSRSPGGSSS